MCRTIPSITLINSLFFIYYHVHDLSKFIPFKCWLAAAKKYTLFSKIAWNSYPIHGPRGPRTATMREKGTLSRWFLLGDDNTYILSAPPPGLKSLGKNTLTWLEIAFHDPSDTKILLKTFLDSGFGSDRGKFGVPHRSLLHIHVAWIGQFFSNLMLLLIKKRILNKKCPRDLGADMAPL